MHRISIDQDLIMLTAEGCRQRRERLWENLNPPPDQDYLVFADPIHLMYLANFSVDPISLASGFPGYLVVRRDGHAKLLCDDRQSAALAQAHVEERRRIEWYDGQSPGRGPRQLAVLGDANPTRPGMHAHDRPGHPYAATLVHTLARMRRQKDPDEIALLRQCMRVTEAGHAWARANIQPGLTELDVYSGVCAACVRAAGRPVIVYGDFAISPGPERRGGPPTDKVLQAGDLFILDFSVILSGYRSDFTNTLAVGSAPRPEQVRLFEACRAAMSAGETQLRGGAPCQAAFDAMVQAFDRAGLAEHFPHHGGHGIGLSHPEDPYIVRHSNQDLLAGDVVTLEPGLYAPGIGGIRIEHNYLITDIGFDRLSDHVISLT